MSNDSPENIFITSDSSDLAHHSHLSGVSVSKSKSDGALKDDLLNSQNNSSCNSPYYHNRVHEDINNWASQDNLYQYSYPSSSTLYPGDTLQSRGRSSSSTNLSESLSSLYLPQISRQVGTTIMSGLNWINQIEFGSLLQSFVNNTNIFRRRNSSSALNPITKNSNSTNAAATMSPLSSGNGPSLTYNSNTFQTKTLARLLNGTMKTLKPSELIELSSFGLVEVENVEPGIGHEFQVSKNTRQHATSMGANLDN